MNLHRLAATLAIALCAFTIAPLARAQAPAPITVSAPAPTSAPTTKTASDKPNTDEDQVKKALATSTAQNIRIYHLPLLEAFNRVRELAGVNVYIDIKSLRVEGVTSNSKVNFSAEKTTAANMLADMLKTVALTKDSLGYDILGRTVVISSKSRLRDLMVQYRTDQYKLGDPEVAKILNREIDELKFDRTPLRDAVKSLADSTGQDIAVDKQSLIIVGTSIETPITLQVKNVPLYQALRLVLNDVGGNVPMDYIIECKKITVYAPAPQ